LARLTREESQALTRAKLLNCAPQVVAKEGFAGASIDKITEAAGFSKGAFYSNFASKEEFFLELLERHAGQDVVEIAQLLKGVSEPEEIIAKVSGWSEERATDPVWGILPIELFQHARREATFTSRHATLFREQWRKVGEMLMPLAPHWPGSEPELLGAMVLELTYGAASSFSEGKGPSVGDLVRFALNTVKLGYGAKIG